MPSPVDERALRRLVVNLAALHADDAAAVLSELEAQERKAVERLLEEFSGFGFAGASAPVASFESRRFSPWLADRLQGRGDMTELARGALAACAGELYPAPLAAAPAAQEKSPGLFKRLISGAS